MLFKEVSWIQSSSSKFSKVLKQHSLDLYQPIKYLPCFLQRPIRFLRQYWHKIPIIVQTTNHDNMRSSINSISTLTGCSIKKEIPLLDSFTTKVNLKTLQKLTENDSVKKIWYDTKFRATLDVACPVIESPTLWESDYTGKGINVAVLDTGVYSHEDLENRIIDFKDFINNKTSPYDDNGHGTHVAGNIAGSGRKSDSLYRGSAPKANIIGVKILNKSGTGSLSIILEAIQWCIDNKEVLDVKIINMSLGAATTDSYKDDLLCQAVEKAWNAGIVVCVAAGNSGPEPSTIDTPGIDPLVITVGSLNDNNTLTTDDDVVSDFSSRGPTIKDKLQKPDVISPGTNIISLRSPCSTIDILNRGSKVDKYYTSLSGTSMATPICAGVVALLLQADDSLTPDNVKNFLTSSATKLEGIDVNAQGFGVINAVKALELLILEQLGTKR